MPGKNTINEIEQGAEAVEKTAAKAHDIASLAESLAPRVKKIYTTGCGSSYWLAYATAELLRAGRIDAMAVPASELYFSDYPFSEQTLVIAFSQSGETTEDIKAIQKANNAKARTLAIVNQPRSAMTKIVDYDIVTAAGNEEIVATKSFDAGLATAYIFAKAFRGEKYQDIEQVPMLYKKVMELDVTPAVEWLQSSERAYAIGIDHDLAVAGELSVKLGEAALVQTTALTALEISHGPKAHMQGEPVIVVGLTLRFRQIYEDIINELRGAGAHVIAYAPLNYPFPHCVNLELPGTDDLTLFTGTKLSQILAVATAVEKGLDPDSPPHLVKSVKRDSI